MLWSAAAALWLFVFLQISYFIHPPPVAMDSGVTFAEYARRGFGELSFATTIVGAIILILDTRPADTTEHDRKMLVRLELALLVALELVLISAFRRAASRSRRTALQRVDYSLRHTWWACRSC